MDITQTAPQTTSQSATQTASPTSGGTSNALASDFETFLKMLTVQMQNQDPLNPIEASDYAVQLATFSNVEQSVKTNQLLEGLQQQFGLMTMSQLAGWVGQEARVTAPVQVTGAPVTISPNPAASADRTVLVIRDKDDTVVAREDIPVSAENLTWVPTAADGSPLPPGRYTITLESYQGDTLLGTGAVEHYARITEAQGSPEGPILVLSGGFRVPAIDVTALRIPPPPPV